MHMLIMLLHITLHHASADDAAKTTLIALGLITHTARELSSMQALMSPQFTLLIE